MLPLTLLINARSRASLFYFDGTTWHTLDTLGSSPSLNNIWVDPTGDAWVTQSNGIIKRWRGTQLMQTYQPCTCFLGSIYGTSPTDIFVTGLVAPPSIFHFDGTSFSIVYSGSKILGGYLGVRDDIWASGGQGGMARWNGTSMTNIALPPEIDNRWIQPVGYLGPNDIWWYVLSGGSGFLHWDGSTLTFTRETTANGMFVAGTIVDGRWWLVGSLGIVYTVEQPLHLKPVIANPYQTTDIWGASDTDTYFILDNNLQHWDGTSLTPTPIAFPGWGFLSAITGIRSNGVDELFAGGIEQDAAGQFVSVAYHHDGTAWTKTELGQGPSLPTTQVFANMYAMGPGEAMGVGTHGLAAHFVNGHWELLTTNTDEILTGAYGPDSDHVWISGTHGTVLRWDRANPLVVTPDTTVTTTLDLGPIHGIAGKTWIASPLASTLWFNDGSGWTELPAQTTGTTNGGLFVTSENDILTAPSTGYMMSRWTGTEWRPEDNASYVSTYNLWKPDGGSMWAGGSNGIVRHP
jgi:hypothetical protein